MNLLVVGCNPKFNQFFRALEQEAGQNVAFCSRGNEALDFCRQTEYGIDWVFFDGLPQGEVMNTIHQLRSDGISSPAILCQTPEPADAHAPLSPILVGIFERSTQGRNLLGCNLVTSETVHGEEAPSFTDEILYEYHAPCAAGKGR